MPTLVNPLTSSICFDSVSDLQSGLFVILCAYHLSKLASLEGRPHGPGASLSKVLKTFQAPKAISKTPISGFSTQTCVLKPLLNVIRVFANRSSQVVLKAHTMLNHQAVLKLRKKPPFHITVERVLQLQLPEPIN